jgi:hypothetical protein
MRSNLRFLLIVFGTGIGATQPAACGGNVDTPQGDAGTRSDATGSSSGVSVPSGSSGASSSSGSAGSSSGSPSTSPPSSGMASGSSSGSSTSSGSSGSNSSSSSSGSSGGSGTCPTQPDTGSCAGNVTCNYPSHCPALMCSCQPGGFWACGTLTCDLGRTCEGVDGTSCISCSCGYRDDAGPLWNCSSCDAGTDATPD